MKKYFDYSIPEEERTDTYPEARDLAQRVIDKFEQEKLAGKDVDDILQHSILREERLEVHRFNHNAELNGEHEIEIAFNAGANAIMAVFVDREGDPVDEIVSAPTPSEITDRDAYNEGFKRYTSFNFASPPITPTNDTPIPSTEEETPKKEDSPELKEENLSSVDKSPKGEESSTSLKRKREDDDDNDEGPSKRAVNQEFSEEFMTSSFDFDE